MKAEIERRVSHRDLIAAYFKSRPLAWIPWVELENVTHGPAWRTRVSDCRRQLQMRIENRKGFEGRSEYRYVPWEPLGRDASVPTVQPGLFS